MVSSTQTSWPWGGGKRRGEAEGSGRGGRRYRGIAEEERKKRRGEEDGIG